MSWWKRRHIPARSEALTQHLRSPLSECPSVHSRFNLGIHHSPPSPSSPPHQWSSFTFSVVTRGRGPGKTMPLPAFVPWFNHNFFQQNKYHCKRETVQSVKARKLAGKVWQLVQQIQGICHSSILSHCVGWKVLHHLRTWPWDPLEYS